MSLLSLVKPLAYISLPVFLLRTASNASPLARYYVRLGIYLSAIGVCSVWGVVTAIGMTLAGNRFDINWVVARSFYHLTSRLLGIYIEIEGEEYLSTRPAVMVMNHQSMLDILVLGSFFPRQGSMTSKKELQWAPLLGQYMTLSGAVFIDRSNNARAVKSVASAGRAMKERGTSIFVFPEGTRTLSEKPDMLSFKKGAFHLAVQAGVPITPIVCENYWRLYHMGKFESGTLKVKVLPPIPTAGLTASDVGDLAVIVRAQMLEVLQDQELSAGFAESAAAASKVTKASKEAPRPSTPEQSTYEKESTPTPDSVPLALAVDTTPSQGSRRSGSDRGPETESDDGLVLVDRPETPSDAARSS